MSLPNVNAIGAGVYDTEIAPVALQLLDVTLTEYCPAVLTVYVSLLELSCHWNVAPEFPASNISVFPVHKAVSFPRSTIGSALCDIVILSLDAPQPVLSSTQYVAGEDTVIDEAVTPVLQILVPIPDDSTLLNAPQ